MTFTYWLPDEQGQKQEYTTSNNSVIIIGANGSGKSHLGAWIEQQDLENVHRIGAQRNLNFNEDIALKSYSQAENFAFYGTDDKDTIKRKDKGNRWAWGKYTTKLVDDFENVLAALIALKHNANDLFVKQCREAEERNLSKPCVPITVLDKLQSIWKEVLPQRDLILEDSKFYDAIRAEQEQKFQAALQGGEYAEAIKVFNCKNISTSVGHFFDIDNKGYCSLVIALLHGDKHDDIVNALAPYLPTGIPR